MSPENKIGVEAYPLYWPEGWKRTRNSEYSKFQTGFGDAREFLFAEIRRMGGAKPILSTNVPLRNDGVPRANMPEPTDRGVAVYFTYKGKKVVFACDKYVNVRDSAWFYLNDESIDIYVRPANTGDNGPGAASIWFRIWLRDLVRRSKVKAATYRQGDVLIRRIDSLPKQKAVKRTSGVLVEGESTGHAHRVADLTHAEVFDIGEGLYLRVGEEGVRIVHEEHGDITLPPGDYEVIRQREYSPEAIRNVAD